MSVVSRTEVAPSAPAARSEHLLHEHFVGVADDIVEGPAPPGRERRLLGIGEMQRRHLIQKVPQAAV